MSFFCMVNPVHSRLEDADSRCIPIISIYSFEHICLTKFHPNLLLRAVCVAEQARCGRDAVVWRVGALRQVYHLRSPQNNWPAGDVAACCRRITRGPPSRKCAACHKVLDTNHECDPAHSRSHDERKPKNIKKPEQHGANNIERCPGAIRYAKVSCRVIRRVLRSVPLLCDTPISRVAAASRVSAPRGFPVVRLSNSSLSLSFFLFLFSFYCLRRVLHDDDDDRRCLAACPFSSRFVGVHRTRRLSALAISQRLLVLRYGRSYWTDNVKGK